MTVLTSLDARDLAAIGVAAHGVASTEGDDVGAQVERLARLAWNEGVRAFVCSPHEAPRLRAALGPEAVLVTPGVRPAAATGGDDQKRTMTAGAAVDGRRRLGGRRQAHSRRRRPGRRGPRHRARGRRGPRRAARVSAR